jgi:hypothetical protein
VQQIALQATGWSGRHPIVAAFGGAMLFKTALVLLVAWLLGVLGVYSVGQLVHLLLLGGLMLLLLAFLKARDAAARRLIGGHSDKR